MTTNTSAALQLLGDPVAQDLLKSKIPARLAYNWTDGTPRVVPIWFTWSSGAIVMASPPKAPKLKALRVNPNVAVTIDSNDFPHKVLLVRGTARVDMVDGIVPEYAAAAKRYFGQEQGAVWVTNLQTMGVTQMGRIELTPTAVRILDFETRFPSAMT